MKKEILQDRSQNLRKQQSPAETIIWKSLRNRRLNGFKFRRQVVITPYIVDFICFQKGLIIELDGGQHIDAINYDRIRDEYLHAKGYKILRYWNNEVFNDLESVLENIILNLGK